MLGHSAQSETVLAKVLRESAQERARDTISELSILPQNRSFDAPHSAHEGHKSIGTKKLLCGNVTKFSIAKNDCAHRILHTEISLETIF